MDTTVQPVSHPQARHFGRRSYVWLWPTMAVLIPILYVLSFVPVAMFYGTKSGELRPERVWVGKVYGPMTYATVEYSWLMDFALSYHEQLQSSLGLEGMYCKPYWLEEFGRRSGLPSHQQPQWGRDTNRLRMRLLTVGWYSDP